MLDIPPLSRTGHIAHVRRCLTGIPASQTEIEASRVALAFYCLGTMDLLGVIEKQSDMDRAIWKEWIWDQYATGRYGCGFRPSPFMTPLGDKGPYNDFDAPHIIMTYTALLGLAILRDDFSQLDRPGIAQLLRSCQREDGSFSTVPNGIETDLRTLYCAFAISSMLDDWSGIDVGRALAFVASCRSYEGGYGQMPHCEANGGPTYIAIASIYLAPPGHAKLSSKERLHTIRWLTQKQDSSGGFCGRTNKDPDSCYCFWCGAALKILGAPEVVNIDGLRHFLTECQFKYGGIAKSPGDTPDPYHTYLSLAALSIYCPSAKIDDPTWEFERLDPLLNAKEGTADWARRYIPKKQ